MLITIGARLVRPYGTAEEALPQGGRIEYRPETHGVWEGALRGRETVTAKIVDGVAEPVELTPGVWKVRVIPDHGTAWDTFLVELTEGMPEPVDLVDLAPVLVVDGEKWARGPAGASVTGAVDNGDQTVSFTLSDGTETDPVPIPPGPQGVGIESISDPDAESRVTVTYTDGSTSTVQAIVGADGHTPTIEWDGTALVIDGETGPDLAGAPGADSTVPGPAPEVAWNGTRLTVGGETSPDLQGPQGNPGSKGDPGNLGATLIYGAGRPDIPSSMTPETAASVAAAVSGAEFISTDGPQGAWRWQKLGTVWIVTVGDTGERLIPLGDAGTAGDFMVSRTGNSVSFTCSSVTSAGEGNYAIWTPTLGWLARHATRVSAPLMFGARTQGSLEYLSTPRVSFRPSSATHSLAARLTWATNDPWPTTLPGDSA